MVHTEDVSMSTEFEERVSVPLPGPLDRCLIYSFLQTRRNRKRRASEALEDPPKPAFDISRIPIEKLWEIFTPTFQRYIELRWPGQDVDEKMRNIRMNTSTEEITNLAKMGPAILSEWRANRPSVPRQSTSGSGTSLGLLHEAQLNIIINSH